MGGGNCLAARRLAQHSGGKRVPATISAIKDAVRWAEEIVKAAQTHELKQSARMPSTWKEGSRLSAFAILAD
jgi:hypothetical protein